MKKVWFILLVCCCLRPFAAAGFCFDCYEENYKIFVKNLECKKGVGCLGKLTDEVEEKGFLSPVKKRKLKREYVFHRRTSQPMIISKCFLFMLLQILSLIRKTP